MITRARANPELPLNSIGIGVGKGDLSPRACMLDAGGDKSLFPTPILLELSGASEKPGLRHNLRVKLAVLFAYGFGLLIPAVLGAGPSHSVDQSEEVPAKFFRLDVRGSKGVVLFNHKSHEARINPDANAPYKAKAGAACIGCHHTANSRGIPQLWKCSSCHRGEGDPTNPKNRDFDEVWSERAFHDSCIGCHRASLKGPTTCGECHKPGS